MPEYSFHEHVRGGRFRALTLENQYLSVTVPPDKGRLAAVFFGAGEPQAISVDGEAKVRTSAG
jgi:hypothetical protein